MKLILSQEEMNLFTSVWNVKFCSRAGLSRLAKFSNKIHNSKGFAWYHLYNTENFKHAIELKKENFQFYWKIIKNLKWLILHYNQNTYSQVSIQGRARFLEIFWIMICHISNKLTLLLYRILINKLTSPPSNSYKNIYERLELYMATSEEKLWLNWGQ